MVLVWPESTSEALQKLLPPLPTPLDPLATALRRKAQTGERGAAEGRPVATGDGWRVLEIVCTSGPEDRPFEERHASASISLVLSGTFVYRSGRGSSFMSPGALLLGDLGHTFECSHQHGEGDRCLSFQFDPDLFERVVHDASRKGRAFGQDRLPPLRTLAPLTARARMAMGSPGSLEELALELAGAVIQVTEGAPRGRALTRDPARIARVLRYLESRIVEPHSLSELACIAGLSRYHFLRLFRCVTGVTPHQWLLRARLREAAQQLVTGRDPVTDIALRVGFEDLSNFIRSFRAEFGMSPSRYRAAA
jgi:AraC family transcriptional regulator